jgi:predicted alpha/beta superfamily hydrolase
MVIVEVLICEISCVTSSKKIVVCLKIQFMKATPLFILLLFWFNLSGQEASNSNLTELTIESEIYQTNRTITVYLPDLYFQDTTKEFVVAYLFDGQFPPYLSMVSSMMEYYSQTEEAIPMIIVAIHTEDRWKEFIPSASKELEENSQSKSSGYAHLLSNYLESEVMPFIDSNYRTLAFKLGIGHSLGGSFLLYEMFKPNSLFDGVIMASPNMILNEEQLVKEGQLFLQSSKESNAFIYVTAGDDNGGMESSFKEAVEKFDRLVALENLPKLDWQFHYLEGENHMRTFPRTFNDGYLAFSNKWKLSDEDLLGMKNKSVAELQTTLQQHLYELADFTKTEEKYSVKKLREIARKLVELQEFAIAVDVLHLAIQQAEIELEEDEKVKSIKEMTTALGYYQFKMKTKEARLEFLAKNYEASCKLYREAFGLGVKNGTHVERLEATEAFSEAGYLKEAFEQLDLLANYFEWQGSNVFVENEHLIPLHKDEKWNKLMKKFEKNKP